MLAGGEERHRDPEPGVHVVVAPAVDVGRMAVRVPRVVEAEAVLPLRVGLLDQATQLGGEPARADELEVPRAAARDVGGVAAADHVHVELGHDGVARHRRMTGEPVGAEQAELLGGVPDEEDRAPGPVGRAGQRLGDLEQPDRAAAVVVGAVEHRVAARAVHLPEAVEQRRDARALRRRGRGRVVLGAHRPHDPVEGAERVVVLGRGGQADVVVVGADRDDLAAERRVPAEQEGDDVAGGRGRRRIHEADGAVHRTASVARGSLRQRLAQQGVGHARGDVEKRGRGPLVARGELRALFLQAGAVGGRDGVECRHRDGGGGGEPLGGGRAVHHAGRSASGTGRHGHHDQLPRRLLRGERRPSAVTQRPGIHRLRAVESAGATALIARR